MRSSRGALIEEENDANPVSLMDLGELDQHLSALVGSADHAKTAPSALTTKEASPPSTPDTTSKSTPRTQSEIIVRIDDADMDVDTESQASTAISHPHPEALQEREALKNPQLLGLQDIRPSFTSSTSALSDQSDLTSLPSVHSSKATTPIDIDVPKELAPAPIIHPQAIPLEPSSASRQVFDIRPKVSIPPDVAPQDYAFECITAAESSRLNPYALHQDEYAMLRDHISHAQVTTYLNIRNGILRLWIRNPRIAVAREEAVGCAKDPRWFEVASICYDWLVRYGYINFGCVEIPRVDKKRNKFLATKRRKTVVVIGAGLSGLGCARQLDGLFAQYTSRFHQLGEEPPQIIILEGRQRLGGRVYSRELESSKSQHFFNFQGKRHTVECGGMIITGFDRGNPLNILVRGQMAIPYHSLRPDTTIYDSNGKPVDPVRDLMVEKLYNDCLERVSDFKFKTQPSKLIEGNRDLMDEGRDSTSEGLKTIRHVEEATAAMPHAPPVSQQSLGPQVDLVPVSTNRATGRTHMEPGILAAQKAAHKAKVMGWSLKNGVTDDYDLHLDAPAQNPSTTLGSLMDEAISQYKDIIDLTSEDYRLMNWHIANLEYSNATNYNQLSLGGWDIDAGNEWEGKHTMIVGGYQNVAWGLAHAPERLDIRKGAVVTKIAYASDTSRLSRVECDDGFAIDADYVISTIPLGVLKHDTVQFEPPLPSWKSDVIKRLGFGILNKVVLVYEEAFWDPTRDIFGVLRNPLNRHSTDQRDYSTQRGRFFQWFNVTKTSGIPVLIALMAGDAGFDTEHTPNDELVAEATRVLRSVYGPKVPLPVNSLVTRWGSDKFARGSYSSAGPDMQPDDYDIMARSIGNLYFAGEHTTGNHPATVHGAYLSGLRAASEVLDAMIGPIRVPVPLIIPRDMTGLATPLNSGIKRKSDEFQNDTNIADVSASPHARLQSREAAIYNHIISHIGDRPWRPVKTASNAYLLYSRANFDAARKKCEESRRPGKGKPVPNEVRVMTSKMWKELAEEEKRPYEEQAAEIKTDYIAKVKSWEGTVKDWDNKAAALKMEWLKANPLPGAESPAAASSHFRNLDSPVDVGGRRRTQKTMSYAESDSSYADMRG